MVNFTDLKFYKSANGGLGGPIDTGAEIATATPNNFFENVPRSELVAGELYYKCFYIKNTHATENMDNFKIWFSAGTPSSNTGMQLGFDDQVFPFEGAIGFDGVNDYLDCGNEATLWSKQLVKFAFAVWVYPFSGSLGDGNDRYIVNHGATANNAFRLTTDATTSNRVKFIIKDSAGINHTVSSYLLDGSDWNHILCTYDSDLGSDNMRIYHNGILQETHDFTGTINLSTGLNLAHDSNDLHGYMRDFKFWDNNNITLGEALELYETDRIITEPESYHLNFKEGTGTTTKDQVSLTKTASFVNETHWKINASTITDIYDSPEVRGGTWYGRNIIPPVVGSLKAQKHIPIWVRRTVSADTTAKPEIDDFGVFTIEFDTTETPSTGTPGTGGGTGGAPPTSPDYKICFAGDWGCEGETNDVIDLIEDEDYDLVIGVGDNAYERADCWIDRFEPLRNKMISAYGNHEYEESGGTSPYKSFFGDSKTYYSHRFQNILFLILDSNDDKSGVDLDAQRTWARDELEKYKNDSTVVWRIAVMHHPWFGSGSKHPSNEFNQVQKFHKLFTDYNVSFVYTGHNHHWVRTHMVAFDSGSPKTPNIVDSSSPYSRTGGGLIAIVSGTGGHDSGSSLYDLPDSASFWAFRDNDNNGVHELVASNNGRTLTGKFRDTDNETYDTFTITA